MIKNILVYLAVLCSAFIFNIFYYEWFSWFLLVMTICVPIVSLVLSLPFMIHGAVNGIIVFAKGEINLNDDFYIGVADKNRRSAFFPQLRINIKAENAFAKQKNKLKIRYGGMLNKPYYKKFNKLSKHCGQVQLKAKYCVISDMTGIFCIPVRINCNLVCNVYPKAKKPDFLPDCDKISVVGYKPKSGGGFSDFYELRQYQSGDSLKNIHWKLSSKYDDIIVREPSIPIYRQFAVKLVFSNNCAQNDDILARFIYACRYINRNGSACFVFSNHIDCISRISNNDELKRFMQTIYSGVTNNKTVSDNMKSLVYSITPNGEEVSEG